MRQQGVHRAHEREAVRERHRRAAEYFRGTQNFDETIYHWLRAGAYPEAAALIEEFVRLSPSDELVSELWVPIPKT